MSEPTSRRVALDTGLSAHVLEWGAGDASRDHTVVLVHGFLDLGFGFARTVSAGLGDRFHILAPDMRGHGDSDRVGAGGYYHFMDYVADLASLIDRLGRARISLVGHSMGGSIVSYYAGAFPQRVHRLALLEGLGPPEDDADVPSRVVGWIAAWRRARETEPRLYPDVEAAADRLRKNDALLDPAFAIELARAGTAAVDGGVRFKHDPLHLTRGPTPYRVAVAEAFWRRITCPVLLVEGSQSSFLAMGEELERRAAFFPAARRARLEGAGHMMQRHKPRELAALLADFLAA